MARETQSRKLGELLVELGLFKEAELSETIQLAMQIQLPLGRALILSSKMTEEELRTVLQLQALLKSGNVGIESAKTALDVVRKEHIPLSVALEKLGMSRPPEEGMDMRSRLATLLLDAKQVTEHQVDEAQRLGYETGTPVGRMLAVSGAITYSLLARTLELQVLLREGKMTYSQAVAALSADSRRELPAEQSAQQRGHSHTDTGKRVRLGELLMLAGLLTESDMLNVIEMGLTSPRPLGDICVETGILSAEVINLALKLQEKILRGEIDVSTAALALQHSEDRAASGELKEVELPKTAEESVRLGDLLKLSGLVDETDINLAIELSAKFPAMIGKMLVVSGAIDEGTLLAALRCQFLARTQAINLEQSVSALQYSNRHRITLDEALEELGMKAAEAAQ